MRIEYAGKGNYRISWATIGGQSLHAIIPAVNRDDALEEWTKRYSLYFEPEVLSGPFATTRSGTPAGH